MIRTFKEAVLDIASSVGRKKASFAVTPNPKTGDPAPFALHAGASKIVKVDGGYVVSMNVRRDQLEKLRDECNELLGVS